MDLDALEALIVARRTSPQMDAERPVPVALVERLCRLAMWAPNHQQTWPWRFALVDGEGRGRLGECVAEAMVASGDEPGRAAPMRARYQMTATNVVVGSAPGDTPTRTTENRDAVAAGVQNLLLGATAAGLSSFWRSCKKGTNEAVAELCGFEPGTTIVAIVGLGWPTTRSDAPPRPPLDLHRI